MAKGHNHDHDDHAAIESADAPNEEAAVLEQAIRELLIEKGLITAAELQQQIDDIESRCERQGALLVARAWSDAAFRKRLLTDANDAAKDIGLDTSGYPLVKVLENTDKVHHLVVCTLCSCYPRGILGPPPGWYKSRPYRSRAVSEPRTVLKEFGTELPDDMEIRVVDSTADLRYLVLPRRPQDTENLNEAELADLVTRDSMVGVAEARTP